MAPTEEPLMRFGVIADVQHANIDNAYNFHRTFMRFYRHALHKFKEAVDTWNDNKVDFAIQLGDIVDGFSGKHGHLENDFRNLTNVVKEFKSVGLPVQKTDSGVYSALDDASEEEKTPYMCHLWGNHEFYNYSRAELWKSEFNSFVAPSGSASSLDLDDAKINNEFGYYYSFTYKGFRFVALDAYDVGDMSRPVGCDLHTKAVSTLKKYKKDDKYPSIVNWNGALSNAQLNWLHNELLTATQQNQKVILLTHVPLDARASREASLIWNAAEVMRMVHCFDCVVACLAGHFHAGGYYHDQKNNIHHVTFQGAIERDPATNAFAVIEVYEDFLKINGYGKIDSKILKF
ncbi:manganese-dependent ADP-ribose/CDP-alcohol diphosphatase-like [Clytia hemisphaerica]|uniref:Calcineurin-like phosphoesterase domain-containing protein n=1 Tax=Clytia hemisphaerica TaxID=252671 RepID=A0A7M5TRX1_9CNID